jgi:exonuclease III
VNSFNLSTFKEGGCKTLEKLVSIMRRKSDIIIITDCRLKGGVEKIRKILRMGRGIQYDLHANSSRADRGVCIAINRARDIAIVGVERDLTDENFILLHCKIEGKELIVGGVYGPNVNNRQFFENLRTKVENYGIPFILGGDFNTILDGAIGEENLDLEERRHIPNKENGKFLREWIENGDICDPFRKKYPMSRCMSYVPFRTRKRVNNVWVENEYGKSRLDFYLISNSLYEKMESVFYGERISRDMDHLENVLLMGKRTRIKKSVMIRNCTLDLPESEEISVLGYLDCLNTHLLHRNLNVEETVRILHAIYIDLCNLRGELEINGVNEQVQERISEMEEEWTRTVRRLGNLEELNDLELQCSPTVFYEVLINEYKNRFVALQGNVDARRTFKRKWLAKKLEIFKRLFAAGSVQIKQCEDDILDYDSREIKAETDKYLEFLRQNNEKPTRGFCKLGKNVSTVDDIEQILDNEGKMFNSAEDREMHITGFYRNLYSKRLDRIIEIENFFSPEELNKINARDQKVPPHIKDSLEGEITGEELEKSLKSSNMNSCPGWDGVAYKLLKKTWEFLKTPICNLANECFNQGLLSPTLRTGLIKLIPKGKNNSRVEDWRPITLLTTSYKIISGVVAGRLETALPYIMGRGQKGFLKYKNMGTCVQNVIDGIADSWEKKEQIGVLMIDFVKAFDSIEHEFIGKALRFFGIGANLARMVGTLLNERRSCIDLNTSHGKYFHIARGAPQGDRSSPYIFIICIEILILKLEEDDSGFIEYRRRAGIFINRQRETNQLVEAFADDLTAIFKWSLNALGRIVTILNEFGNLSGLTINKSKTSIMICGKEWAGGESVLGIKIVSSCKLLGILIDNKSADLDRNWVECSRKIWGLIHYWTNFRLSLTGRIMVAKTFLISQATFYMGIILLDKKKAAEIEKAINKYVCGGLQIAQDRINNRIEQGGLGLIKLEELDTAIKCGWVNRWLKDGNKRDITGSAVFELGNGCLENIDIKLMGRSKLPCMTSIAAAWTLFRKKYYENESNIYEARIFANPGILSTVGQQLENKVFVGGRAQEIMVHLRGIRLIALLNDRGAIKDKRELEALIPNLSRSEFLRLKTEVNFLIRKYKPRIEMRESAKNIEEFLTGIKKGSCKYRSKMSGRGSLCYANFESSQIKPVNTLWEQLGLV